MVLDAGREEDRLAAGVAYRRATPEAALLHWLYLAHSPRSEMSRPPSDLELGALDSRKLNRLAGAMNLREQLGSWLGRKEL
jgi:hypothetical protein